MLNVLYDESYEIIEGEKFMSPSPHRRHMYIMGNIFFQIMLYTRSHNVIARIFLDNMDIHLPDGTLVKPDLSVVCNPDCLKHGATVVGVPDFVVEILSHSTMRRDLTVKKNIYERNGIREYWIINPWDKSVSVNILTDGKYYLSDIYTIYTDEEWAELTDEEKAEVKFDIPLSIFEDFSVNINDIFYRIED